MSGADISLFIGLPVAAVLYWLLARKTNVAAETELAEAEEADLDISPHEHVMP